MLPEVNSDFSTIKSTKELIDTALVATMRKASGAGAYWRYDISFAGIRSNGSIGDKFYFVFTCPAGDMLDTTKPDAKVIEALELYKKHAKIAKFSRFYKTFTRPDVVRTAATIIEGKIKTVPGATAMRIEIKES